jgi:hypothetical protein
MRLLSGTLLALVLIPRFASAQDVSTRNYLPARGFVPDSATAVRIALAVWIPIYGEPQIMSEAPFVATLTDSIWTVTGTKPRSPGPTVFLLGYAVVGGGPAVARIARRDGRILLVTDGT